MKKTVLKLSAASIGALHCINKYIDTTVSDNRMKSTGKIYNWKNGNIFYRVSGQGKPILLLHDVNVFSSENDWNQVMSSLSEDNRVYAPDLIGCGRSDKPAVTYTGYFYVQMITDFVKNVIREKTTVIASGRSSVFALMANALDTEIFDKMIFINPPAKSSIKKIPDQHSKILIRLFGLPIIGKTCYYMATSKTNTEDYFSERVFFNPFLIKQQTVRAAYQSAHYGSGNGRYLFASLEGGYLNTDPTEALKKAGKEITVLISDHLPGSKETADNYAKINESVKIRTLKNTKQLPELETPDIVADIILESI